MSASGRTGSSAFNAGVLVNGKPLNLGPAQHAREQRVIDCDAAVEHIKQKLAGMRAALAAAEAEAKQARAEAQSEGN